MHTNTHVVPLAVEHGYARPPAPGNEPVRDYAPGSPERASLARTLSQLSGERIGLPLVIGGRAVETGRLAPVVMPHNYHHVLADAHMGGSAEVDASIQAALKAAPEWSRRSPTERAAVFLKAADLLAGPWRNRLNAATMLGQSKTVHQAEIDSAAELIDFWRWNVEFMYRIYAEQSVSPSGVWNRIDYRPLEGFVFAITPFNFTAIAGNLPSAPALMGNTVVWKPAATAMYSAHFVMELLREAGLPDGVINLVYGDGAEIANVVLSSPHLAGVHFTGSTGVFNNIVQTIGERTGIYRTYPRVVGETGGKNFVLAHASADRDALAAAIIRGGFEYQGQKCSAASRIYIPESLWPSLRERLCDEIATIRVGDIANFSNFMGAVIDEKAWSKHAVAIDEARSRPDTTILTGGGLDKDHGYFVEPTLVVTTDPRSRLLRDELFGPIVTAFVYPDNGFRDMITAIDESSLYGLTGALFARDRSVIAEASDELRNAAGNFYINDKPTGAVVGQQPFGGARASGTNDKAGSMWNLIRWVSPRAIKETFAPPTDYRYPFLVAE
ncbi:L-glutamate gamma-semialdehyde dehydrogenase [Microvirga sp. TS319]|uniref:L-glutamate gamma-semialdehyde dehydrogenase n=1 Tax=Microvirga sp. TS319 TaxID=3241165 RepID=UPI00351A9659